MGILVDLCEEPANACLEATMPLETPRLSPCRASLAKKLTLGWCFAI